MSTTSTFGLPQIIAFIVTLALIIGLATYLVSIEKRTGQGKAMKIATAIFIWTIFHFITWGTAGFVSGNSFLDSGFDSLKMIIKTIPALLKGL
jgi:hypothetical protein